MSVTGLLYQLTTLDYLQNLYVFGLQLKLPKILQNSRGFRATNDMLISLKCKEISSLAKKPNLDTTVESLPTNGLCVIWPCKQDKPNVIAYTDSNILPRVEFEPTLTSAPGQETHVLTRLAWMWRPKCIVGAESCGSAVTLLTRSNAVFKSYITCKLFLY